MTLQQFQHKDNPEKLSCAYDWIVWMESDVWITNSTIKFEDIIEEGTRLLGKVPDLITNKGIIFPTN